MADELTTTESSRLASLETTIERGRQSFVEVGHALIEIRESKLYRQQAETFDAYCQLRWEFTRRHANRLMEAADAVAELSSATEKGDTCVPSADTGRTATALAKAPKGERVSVMKEAATSAKRDKKTGRPKVTAKDVHRVVAKRKPQADPKPATAQPDPPPTELKLTEPTDALGNVLPERQDVRAAFVALPDLNAALHAHDQVIAALHRFFPTPAAARLASQRQRIEAGYKELRQSLYQHGPHALCPDCHGESKSCGKCDGTGWITREAWKRHQKATGAA